MNYFEGIDFAEFWKESDYARREYVLPKPTDTVIESVQNRLGYRLPAAYIQLMRVQNGGLLTKTAFPTTRPTSWAEDHVAIHGILGIGDSKKYSLCGEFGSRFMIAEWGYPPIGIYFGDCPSAGHDMIGLDYRGCGPVGEPKVVHVDQEADYRITHLADNFELFINGLVKDEQFAITEDDSSVAFVWQTDVMAASIRRDDEFLMIGQHLYLEQSLAPEDVGWLTMKLNIPEHWEVKRVAVRQGMVRLDTKSSGAYRLTRENVPKLSFDLLDGGANLPNDQLQAIWKRHAALGE